MTVFQRTFSSTVCAPILSKLPSISHDKTPGTRCHGILTCSPPPVILQLRKAMTVFWRQQRVSNNVCSSLPTAVTTSLLTLMSKRVERSSSSSMCSKLCPKRNKHKSDNKEATDSLISLKQLLDKLNSMESIMEDNFSNLNSQIA